MSTRTSVAGSGSSTRSPNGPQGLGAIGPCAVMKLLVGVQPMPRRSRDGRSEAGKPLPRTWPARSQVQTITISSRIIGPRSRNARPRAASFKPDRPGGEKPNVDFVDAHRPREHPPPGGRRRTASRPAHASQQGEATMRTLVAASLALAAMLGMAQAQEPIKIGALYNLTGGMSSLDGPSLKGAQLAVEADQRRRRPARPPGRADRAGRPHRPAGDGEGGAARAVRGRGGGHRPVRHHLRDGRRAALPGGGHPVRHLRRHPSRAAAVGRRPHVHDALRRRRPELRHRRLHLRQARGAAGGALDRQLDGLHQGALQVLRPSASPSAAARSSARTSS